jgi:hypothetical protein
MGAGFYLPSTFDVNTTNQVAIEAHHPGRGLFDVEVPSAPAP